MSVKTPDYVLTEKHSIYYGPQDTKHLEPGTFVRPVEYRNLPKSIRDIESEKLLMANGLVYCYTYYGLVPIPRKILRER